MEFNCILMWSRAGINVLFSGGFDEISFTVSAYKSLLPALVPYLSQNQPPTPYPPNPEVYEGEYTVANVVATIKSVQGQLLFQLSTSGFYLAYHEPLQMTVRAHAHMHEYRSVGLIY